MKVVCCVCHKVMKDGPEPTSHGICPECAEKALRDDDWPAPEDILRMRGKEDRK